MILVFRSEILENRDALASKKNFLKVLVLRVEFLALVCCVCLRWIYFMGSGGSGVRGVCDNEYRLATVFFVL